MIVRYSERFDAALMELNSIADSHAKLRRCVQLYEDVLVRDRMRLCGMLAAEYSTLPVAMQRQLRRFFDRNDLWLEKSLEAVGDVASCVSGAALEAARTVTAGRRIPC